MDNEHHGWKPATPPRRHRRGAMVATAVIALLVLVTGCAPETPGPVLHVPGQYIANMQLPSGEYAPASVTMCLDSQSAVLIETGDGGDSMIGWIELEWKGTTYHVDDGGGPVTMTTPVLDPGCGKLSFFFTCCRVVDRLAVKVTKV